MKTAPKGFNLIELATVMGIVALVLGGVWLGVAAVKRNLALNQEVKSIQIIVENISSGVSDRMQRCTYLFCAGAKCIWLFAYVLLIRNLFFNAITRDFNRN